MLEKLDSYLLSILILLQRTELQRKYKYNLFSKLNVFSGGLLSLARVLLQALDSSSVLKAYENGELLREQSFEVSQLISKAGFTQNSSFSIADIGSGIGGYHRNWLSDFPNGSVILIDQTKFNFTSLFYGHGKPNRHYNNLRLAKKFLLLSGTVKPAQIDLVDKRKLEGKLNTCEIVVSFFSLGFHYPIETYWDSVWTNTKVKVLLLDVRKNSESEIYLLQNSSHEFEITKISSNVRSARYLVTRLGSAGVLRN